MRKFTSNKIHTNFKKVDVCCPVCLFMCRDKVDFDSVRTDGACTECVANFKYIMGKKWEEGQRPTAEQAIAKIYKATKQIAE